MSEIVIQALKEDREFFERLRSKADNVEIIEMDRFEGLSEVIQVVVSITATITPIIVAYFKEQTQRAKNRVLIKDGRKLRLQGYSADEIERLLSNDKVE